MNQKISLIAEAIDYGYGLRLGADNNLAGMARVCTAMEFPVACDAAEVATRLRRLADQIESTFAAKPPESKP